MGKPGETGMKRIMSAMENSMVGLKDCWKNEAAFRQEVIGCVIFLPLGLYLGEGGVEKALLAAACLQVLIVELLNSGIEAVVDRVSHEHHQLSGLAKDLGSAAVLISIAMWGLIWGLVLLF